MMDRKFYTVSELEEMIATAYRHGCDDTMELVIDYLRGAKKSLKNEIKRIREKSNVRH